MLTIPFVSQIRLVGLGAINQIMVAHRTEHDLSVMSDARCTSVDSSHARMVAEYPGCSDAADRNASGKGPAVILLCGSHFMQQPLEYPSQPIPNAAGVFHKHSRGMRAPT